MRKGCLFIILAFVFFVLYVIFCHFFLEAETVYFVKEENFKFSLKCTPVDRKHDFIFFTDKDYVKIRGTEVGFVEFYINKVSNCIYYVDDYNDLEVRSNKVYSFKKINSDDTTYFYPCRQYSIPQMEFSKDFTFKIEGSYFLTYWKFEDFKTQKWREIKPVSSSRRITLDYWRKKIYGDTIY